MTGVRMNNRAFSVSPTRCTFRRLLLTATLVLVPLHLSWTSANAQSLSSRNEAVTSAATQATQAAAAQQATRGGGLTADQTQALQRQLSLQSRNALAIQAMRNAQDAARGLAIKDPANNLFDSAGKPLNGLGAGALDAAVTADAIAAGLTKQDKAQDQRQVWDGGLAPTQTIRKDADGKDKYDVTVKQTQANAIFSWKTFNVGKDTELLFDQAGNKGWVALNRVVGGLDENGRRENGGPAPSQILGKIKADGTVVVLNQNGVIFTGSSQINVNTLIASTAEVGRATITNPANPAAFAANTLANRNAEYLANGLTGVQDLKVAAIIDNTQAPADTSAFSVYSTNSTGRTNPELTPPSDGILVNAGAQITANSGGSILLNSVSVQNDGTLTAPQGNVALVSSLGMRLVNYDGKGGGGNANIRGLGATAVQLSDAQLPGANTAAFQSLNFVSRNLGLISAPEGSIQVVENASAAAVAAAFPESARSLLNYTYADANGKSVTTGVGGVLSATTSVDRNGYIAFDRTLAGSIVSILPELNGKTVPLAGASGFKTSAIDIGYEVGADALVLAPSGNITVGSTNIAAIGQIDAAPAVTPSAATRYLIDAGATIDVSGLKDVVLDASRNQLVLGPLKGNELADSPDYRLGFLNGATVYLDPRQSGVRADGTAWIGSPLIDAKAAAGQIPVGVEELLTKGGSVTVAGKAVTGTTNAQSPDTIIATGATIDISGGWIRYQAGFTRSTQLLGADGRTYDISEADPTTTRFVGFAGDFIVNHPRWGVTERYSSLGGSGKQGVLRFNEGYIEGRDAGALNLTGSINVFDGTLYAQAYAGARQIADGKVGTGKGSFLWDQRALQAVSTQLPSGGLLLIGAKPRTFRDDDLINAGLAPQGNVSILPDGSFDPVMGNLGYTDEQLAIIDRDRISGYNPTAIIGQAPLPLTPDQTIFDQRGGNTLLSESLINNSGLSQVTVSVDGTTTIPKGVDLKLPAGGLFEIVRSATIDGSITVPSGRIVLGSNRVAYPDRVTGTVAFDNPLNLTIAVNGSLSVSGQWVNNLNASSDTYRTTAYAKGGSITLDDGTNGAITVGKSALLDLGGGGSVSPNGKLDLTAKGGSLAFRSTGTLSKLTIDPDAAIRSAGFGGGGTYAETSLNPFGIDTGRLASFISNNGFSSYTLTSADLGKYRIFDISSGQTLKLRNRVLPSLLSSEQAIALNDLKTGGDVQGLLGTTDVPDLDGVSYAYYRNPVNLTLAGLLALNVERGGSLIGEAGMSLTVSKLLNAGTVRLPGGKIVQSELSRSILIDATRAARLDPLDFDAAGLNKENGIELLAGSVTDLSGISVIDPLSRGLIGGVLTTLRSGRVLAGGSVSLAAFGSEQGDTSLPPFTFSDDKGTPRFSPVLKIVSRVRPRRLFTEAGSSLLLDGARDVFDFRDVFAKTGYSRQETASAAGSLSATNGFTLGGLISARGGDASAGGGTLDLGGTVNLGRDANKNLVIDSVARIALSQSDRSKTDVLSADLVKTAGFDNLTLRDGFSSVGDVNLALGGSLTIRENVAPFVANTVDGLIRYPVIGVGGNVTISAPYIALSGLTDDSGIFPIAGSSPNTLTLNARQIDLTRAVLFDNSIGRTVLNALGDIRILGGVNGTPTGSGATGRTTLKAQIAAAGNITFTAQRVYPTTGTSALITSSSADGVIAFERVGAVTATPYTAGASLTVQAANIVQNGALFVPQGALTLGGANTLTRRTGSASTLKTYTVPATATLTFGPDSLTSVSGGSISIPYGITTDQKEWFFTPTGGDPLTAPPSKLLSVAAGTIDIQRGAVLDLSGGGDLFAYEFVPGTGGNRDVLNFKNPDANTNNPGGFLYPDGRQVYAIVPGLSDAPIAAYDPLYSASYGSLSGSEAGKRVFLNDGVGGLKAGWYTLLPAQYAVLPGGVRIVERTGASTLLNQGVGTQPDGSQLVTGLLGTIGTVDSTKTRLFEVQSQAVFNKYSKIALTSANTYFPGTVSRDAAVPPRLPVDAGQIAIAAGRSFSNQGTFFTAAAGSGRGSIVDVSGDNVAIVSPGGAALDSGIDYTVYDVGDLVRLNAESLLIGGTRQFQKDGTVLIRTTAGSITVANDAANPLYAPDILFAVGFAQNIIVRVGDGRPDNTPTGIAPDVRRSGDAKSIAFLDGATVEARGVVRDTSTTDYVARGGYSFPGTGAESIGDQRSITAGAFLRVSNGPERFIRRDGLAGDADLACTGVASSGCVGGQLNIGGIGAPTAAQLRDRYSVSLDIASGASLTGSSILADVGTYANPTLSAKGFAPTQSLSIGTGARISGGVDAKGAAIRPNLALTAGKVTFGEAAPDGFRGLLVTRELSDRFSRAGRLTVSSSAAIAFDAGEYDFGDLSILAPSIQSSNGDVTLKADRLELGNRFAASTSATAGGDGTTDPVATNPVPGDTGDGGDPTAPPPVTTRRNKLLIDLRNELLFGSGTVGAFGFDGGVTINAAGGIFATNGEGGLNANNANLTLNTPIITDRLTKTGDTANPQPRFTFRTTGALSIVADAPGAAPAVQGYPGSALTFDAGSILVSGSRVRTTAGATQLIARSGDITIGNGAIVESRGYDKVFGTPNPAGGKAYDPVVQAAPSGRVRLQADRGSIFAGASATLNVGGGIVVDQTGKVLALDAVSGNSGTLEIVAPNSTQTADAIQAALLGTARNNGTSAYGRVLETPRLGAGLTLDLGGSFDFAGFANRAALTGFTGDLDVRTRSGGLVLTANQAIRAQSVKLTADGGLVDIAGTIDTSATNGGDIALYGRTGVIVRGTGKLIAEASGYSPKSKGNALGLENDDARVAKGGNVTLGTDFTASAIDPETGIVSGTSGAITLENGATISVAARRTGGRLIPLLRNGVTFYNYASSDQGGKIGLRAPVLAGNTVNVDVSAGANLNGARDIALEGFRRWDLGTLAGVAGSGVTVDPGKPNGVLIDPRGSYFNGITDEKGNLTLNAAGKVTAANPNGVVSFIQDFAIARTAGTASLLDRANFIAKPGLDLANGGDITLTRGWNFAAGAVDANRARADGIFGADGVTWNGNAYDYINVSRNALTPALTAQLLADLKAPSLDAVTDLQVKEWFDAKLFSDYTSLLYRVGGTAYGAAPTLALRAGGNLTINGSISDGFFQFRDQTGDYLREIIDAYPVSPAGGFTTAQYTAALQKLTAVLTNAAKIPYNANGNAVSPNIALTESCGIVCGFDPNGDIVIGTGANRVTVKTLAGINSDPFGSQELFPRLLNPNTGASSASYILTGGAATLGVNPVSVVEGALGDFTVTGSYFYQAVPQLRSSGAGAQVRLFVDRTGVASVSPFIRTGSGSINTAAAASIDLKASDVPTYILLSNVGASGGFYSPSLLPGTQGRPVLIGGASIYTAGERLSVTENFGNLVEGFEFDTSRYNARIKNTNFTQSSIASYLKPTISFGPQGATISMAPVPGLLTADPIFTGRGGNISVSAGGSIVGQLDLSNRRVTTLFEGLSAIAGDVLVSQPWRVGSVGSLNVVRSLPNLFGDGVGTLAGGNITVQAGLSIDQLTTVADSNLFQAAVTGDQGNGTSTETLLTFGGGNVNIFSGQDYLTGRIDIASGSGSLISGRDIRSNRNLSSTPEGLLGVARLASRILRPSVIKLGDASFTASASRDLSVPRVTGLGVSSVRLRGVYQREIAEDFYAATASLRLNAAHSVVASGDFTSVLPPSLMVTAITGNISLPSLSVSLVPSGIGQLGLFAGGTVVQTAIDVDDSDAAAIPGLFSPVTVENTGGGDLPQNGRFVDFPDYRPSANSSTRRLQHSARFAAGRDDTPIYVYAGRDVDRLLLSTPKVTRIDAGRDILNVVLFGQNLRSSDVSLVKAGRDIIGERFGLNRTYTSGVTSPLPNGPVLPTALGNLFEIGGPGTLILEAGRDAGPFVNSAVSQTATAYNQTTGAVTYAAGVTYPGGILSVGNENNPFLAERGAGVTVRFGTAKGTNWDGFQGAYVDPVGIALLPDDLFVQVDSRTASVSGKVADRTRYVYEKTLIDWVNKNVSGTSVKTYAEAYTVFAALPALNRQLYLQEIYFQELIATAKPDGPSYLNYGRGYAAVNALFSPALGYTANNLSGGANGANTTVSTGDLDLRLATIQTVRGGDLRLLGPGGRVIAGSVVATDQQAARLNYSGSNLFIGLPAKDVIGGTGVVNRVAAIPSGLEGLITLRGGSLYSFTDGDFLLNQSRAFTRQGGDIAIWSSNGDVNAGQGAKTSSNFPPVAVRCDINGFCEQDQAASTTGAGIAAFKPTVDALDPDVYLIAPRGTVDAGDAGLRVAGNLSIAAKFVLNADNISVGGKAIGVPVTAATNTGALITADTTAAAAAKEASPPRNTAARDSIIIVEIIGFGGGDGIQDTPRGDCPGGAPKVGGKCPAEAAAPKGVKGADSTLRQNPNFPVKVVGAGILRADEAAMIDPLHRARLVQ